MSVDWLRCILLAWVLIDWGVLYLPQCWLVECWLVQACFSGLSVDWLSLLVLNDCFLLFQRENQRLEMQRTADDPSVWVASSFFCLTLFFCFPSVSFGLERFDWWMQKQLNVGLIPLFPLACVWRTHCLVKGCYSVSPLCCWRACLLETSNKLY